MIVLILFGILFAVAAGWLVFSLTFTFRIAPAERKVKRAGAKVRADFIAEHGKTPERWRWEFAQAHGIDSTTWASWNIHQRLEFIQIEQTKDEASSKGGA